MGILSVLPRISATPASTLDTTQPISSTPFTISNDGLLDIHNVQISCIYAHVDSKYAQIDTPGPYKEGKLGGFLVPDVSPVLESSRKRTFDCFFPFIMQTPILHADIILVINFRQSFLPFRSQRTIRFVTAGGPDGTLHWFEEPVPK